ncbi:MAG TPA: formate dehydrogenase subunit alpha, partial [Anaerolineales bacterium]|nr:formate dehydrogenase subunit alpha [Anaerolineales bacterium]
KPVGGARPDWQIMAELARHVQGEVPLPKTGFARWEYENTAQIMEEIAALTPIYHGVTHQRLMSGECLAWPVYAPDHTGTPHLTTGMFYNGRQVFSEKDKHH